MTAGVFDYKFIAARLARRPLPPECIRCSDKGWEQFNYGYGMTWIECPDCHNPKGHKQP